MEGYRQSAHSRNAYGTQILGEQQQNEEADVVHAVKGCRDPFSAGADGT
ncbi:MAG: hypothetical protein ABI599_17020 [Flavobacteriales bacterium]